MSCWLLGGRAPDLCGLKKSLKVDEDGVACREKSLKQPPSGDVALRHSSAIIATCRRGLLGLGRDRHLFQDLIVETNYTRA